MTVGVVIPCRNEARWLAEVLAALLAQDHRPDEVVVVDDGSVDRTIGVVDDWRARNEGLAVRVIAGPRRGIAAAVNAGIAVIGTDVVVRLDGHCCPDREYIGRAVAHLSEP
ncbi:MAG TPA: glycosyltransferase, partial [Jatrophihabitantaceae bacterium]|nr:glycosyltransferase [Jatrophihabitantaceae bacterium]